MSVIAERQVAAGMTGNPQTEKSRYVLVMEPFGDVISFGSGQVAKLAYH